MPYAHVRQHMKLAAHRDISFKEICIKTIVVHTVTYFIAGSIALVLLNYGETSSEIASLFRGIDDTIVMLGPILQFFRGLVFASVFYLLREVLFGSERGWLVLFWLLVGVGVLSTFGPAPASIEAIIYTTFPVSVWNYVEVVPQALALAFLLAYWIANPNVRWFERSMFVAFFLIYLLIILGILSR